jgi:dihydroorotase
VEAGAHADIAVVDLARTETIAAERLHSRGKITPFEGKAVTGIPVHTLVRGRFVQRDRALVRAAKGWGRQVTGIQAMPPAVPRNRDQTLASVVHG